MSLIGQTLGQYQIIEQIGKGGMATVYRAKQANIGRDVAVKVLDSSLIQKDESFLERFNREVQIISHLQHPHIMPVIDFGEHDGQPYIVVSYLTGGTLSDLINQEKLSFDHIIKLTEQMANALDFAHSRGIIHRDFKPSNILLDENGNTYLADFGLSRFNDDDSQLTGSSIVGTPDYTAPDLANAIEITSTVDVYALGVTLFQMLTGKLPFKALNPMGVLMAHISTDIPNIYEIYPDLPEGLQPVIDKAMAKRPKDRYATAGEMLKDLKTITGSEGGSLITSAPSSANSNAPHTEPKKALLFINVEGIIVYVNNSFLRLIERQESEMRTVAGRPLHTALAMKEKSVKKIFKDIKKIGNLFDLVLTINEGSEDSFEIIGSATATYDDKGDMVGIDFSFNPALSDDSSPSKNLTGVSDFSTGEKSFIQLYFNYQVDALQVLLRRIAGNKLAATL
ncbi:MAG: serine/threonine protein kinase, partial [Chloroflexota bacterium]